MKEFLAALENLENCPSQDIFNQLFQFFSKVNGLNDRDVVSAWQALQALKTGVAMADFKKVTVLEDALLGRMYSLCMEKPAFSTERSKMADTFGVLTSRRGYFVTVM